MKTAQCGSVSTNVKLRLLSVVVLVQMLNEDYSVVALVQILNEDYSVW